MKPFMDHDFLLTTQTAKTLYHSVAEPLPIIDYHCHLPVADIAADRQFKTITELWLEGDHYKWRGMRSAGIDEKYITGDADDRLKFRAWAETVVQCIGNPLYHWTHLELRRTFSIQELLSPETADDIYDRCNQMLSQDEFSVRGLIEAAHVEVICTTDDPADSLQYHIQIAKEWSVSKVLPTFRPDRYLNPLRPEFQDSIALLTQVSEINIQDYDSLLAALLKRVDFFHTHGCRLSDHALEPPVFGRLALSQLNLIIKSALNGEFIDKVDAEAVQAELLIALGEEFSRREWVMQYHIGTIRNLNSRALEELGPDTGFDAIGDAPFAANLVKLMDGIESSGGLPRTILYCLNPSDNEVIGTIIGAFQGSGIAGKIQFGSGWWFNDQKEGMIRQISSLANLGLLSQFVGMLTDSRSFISYPRHEYFRRILCRLMGEWVEAGEFPADEKVLNRVVRDICYQNALNYFRF